MGVQDAVKQFIKDNFFVDDVGDDESFMAGGVIDSLGIMQLVAFVQTQFGVEVPDGDLLPENFDSVARVAAYVDRKRKAA